MINILDEWTLDLVRSGQKIEGLCKGIHVCVTRDRILRVGRVGVEYKYGMTIETHTYSDIELVEALGVGIKEVYDAQCSFIEVERSSKKILKLRKLFEV